MENLQKSDDANTSKSNESSEYKAGMQDLHNTGIGFLKILWIRRPRFNPSDFKTPLHSNIWCWVNL